MALPDSISTNALNNGYNPPHKSSGGNYYVVVRNGTIFPDVFKSTAPGSSSWTHQDSTNTPTGLNAGTSTCVSSVSDGTYIHIVTLDVTTLSIEYHRFNMSTDTWDQVNSVVADLSGMSTPSTSVYWCSIAYRAGATGDELVIAGCGLVDTVMGNDYQRVDLWHGASTGTPSWTGPVSIDASTAARQEAFPQLVTGTSDAVHILWSYDDNVAYTSADGMNGRTLNSSNSLSTVQNSSAVNSVQTTLISSNLITWDDAGTQRIWAKLASRGLLSSEDGSGNMSTLTGTPTSNRPITNSLGSVVVDSSGVIYYLAQHTDSDLYVISSSDNASTWDTPVELIDLSTINFISAEILDTGTVAYLYDDNGATKYNEYSLSSAYSVDLSSGNFKFTAQNPNWSADYSADTSAGSFSFTANALTQATNTEYTTFGKAKVTGSTTKRYFGGTTLNYPSEAKIGDSVLLLMAYAYDDTNQLTTPTGFDLVRAQTYTSAQTGIDNGLVIRIFKKSSDYNGESTLTISDDIGGVEATSTLVSITNLSGTYTTAVTGTSASTTINPPAATNTYSDGFSIVASSFVGGNTTVSSYSTNYTSISEDIDDSSGDVSLVIEARDSTPSGSNDPDNITFGSSVGIGLTIHVLFEPDHTAVENFNFNAQTIDYIAAYDAQITSASFGFTAQSLSWAADYNTDTTAASFSFTANDLSYAITVSEDLTAASFGFTTQNPSWVANYSADLTASSFSFTANDLSYVNVAGDWALSAATFSFTSQNFSYFEAYDVDLTIATFGMSAQSQTWIADYTAALTAQSFNFTPQSISDKADYDANLTAASFLMTGQQLSVTSGYIADISSANFSFSALSGNWNAAYNADMTSPAFSFTVQNPDWIANYSVDITSAIFSFTSLALTYSEAGVWDIDNAVFNFTTNTANWKADYTSDLTVASFSFTTNTLSWVSQYSSDLTAAAFSFTANDLTYGNGYQVILTDALFNFNSLGMVVGSTVNGVGFYEFTKPVDENTASGAGFFNDDSSTSGGDVGFFNPHSGNSGNGSGFY